DLRGSRRVRHAAALLLRLRGESEGVAPFDGAAGARGHAAVQGHGAEVMGERLGGKVAAVTGGASGIGEATVRRFVAEGAKVAFADRDVDRGKRVAAEIEATGGQALFVEAHVERETEAAGFIQQAANHFGRLDVLVNNAGIRM